jgi:large subunit ribosomal protein L23
MSNVVNKKQISEERVYEIIRSPLITEKATALSQFNQYVFEVMGNATKSEIKQAVEKLFKVTVLGVNTVLTKGKTKRFKGRMGRRQDLKKAIVSVKQGQTIDVSVGV